MKINIESDISGQIVHALTTDEDFKILGTIDEEDSIITVTNCVHGNESKMILTRPILYDHKTRQGLVQLIIQDDQLAVYFRNTSVEIVEHKQLDFFKRHPENKKVMRHLSLKKPIVFGIGSEGAPICQDLGKSGVGSIIGIDKDVLEIHNCMRHTLGPAYIGWKKAKAMESYFKEHIPTCDFKGISQDFFSEGKDRWKLKELIEKEKPTHILAVTDVLDVQYQCQRLAREYNLPLMAVWCDNNAVEGEIFFWEPGQAEGWQPGRPERGCYACLRPMDKVTITRSKHFDYSSDDPDSFGGEPALGCFINRINNIASIFMIGWMLQDCKEPTKLATIFQREYHKYGSQYLRLGGPYLMESQQTITAENPWSLEWWRVKKHNNCPICADAEENRQALFPEVIDETDEWI